MFSRETLLEGAPTWQLRASEKERRAYTYIYTELVLRDGGNARDKFFPNVF